jgi:hypothetical protein
MLPPALPSDDVIIHDVLADEAARYERRDGVVRAASASSAEIPVDQRSQP